MEKRDYTDPIYKMARLACFKRDKFKCLWCGSKKKINCHHLKRWSDYPTLRYCLSNLICLCKMHHTIVTGKEEQYEEFLLGLISSKGNSQIDIERMLRIK